VDAAELDKAQASGENGEVDGTRLETSGLNHSAEEIANLKKEAAAFREVRKQLGDESGPSDVFSKASQHVSEHAIFADWQVFSDDIKRLLAMEDMWKGPGRVKPVALDYEAIMKETFVKPPLRSAPAAAPTANGESSANGVAKEANGAPVTNGTPVTNGETSKAGAAQANAVNGKGPTTRQLKDQKELSVKENLELFIDRSVQYHLRAVFQLKIQLSTTLCQSDCLPQRRSLLRQRRQRYARFRPRHGKPPSHRVRYSHQDPIPSQG
jgi:ubiquitin-like 1-activating enzyme E1 B